MPHILIVDPGTNMPNTNGSGDRKNAGIRLASGLLVVPQRTDLDRAQHSRLSTPGYVTICGDTYIDPTVPASTTGGIGYANCTNFGDTTVGDGCALSLTSSSYIATGFSYGLTDSQQFASSISGGGLLGLTMVATTTYSAEAEVTYEYSVPSGTPEPGTMVLLGSALVGLGVIRKRSRRA